MVSDFDYAFALGTITCGLLEFQQVNYDAVGRKFTLIEALSTTADLLVSSDHATATYTLDLSAFNYALTAKTITIGTRGILTGRASTITSSGNVDFSAGQFNKNTSTLIMTGAGKTIKTANTNGAPYNLQVSGTISTLSSLNVTNNLTIDASKSLTMGTGKTLTVGGNMSVGSGGAMTLQDNLYTVNPLINNGAITQNNKWFNVSSSSATPLTGYGTFDGNLGLNGSLASSYQVQTGLPMGNLYTDRDTQISLDSTRYLRAAPASTEFVGVSVKSYGSESGYLARFDGTSTGPVTYTLVGSPNELYDVWVDHTTRVSVVQASSDGTIQFTYNGPFSSHEFIVSKSSGPPVNLQASFSYSIDGSTVSFIDKSYGGVTEYLWDFGDGTGSTAQNPSHRYTKAGDYTVSLTVYDSKGHSSTAKTTITLELGPDFPIERTPKGWNIWVSDQAIISAPAVAFLAFGIWMLASVRFQPLMPFLSPKLKKILGIILLVVAIYWYGFIDNNWFGG
jgi:hypothetical protein